MRIKISAAWANHKIACKMPFIIQNCGGCCGGGKVENKYWPPSSNNNKCFYLTKTGCSLSLAQKPIRCQLYPFIFNPNNTMIVHWRTHNYCGANYNLGDTSLFEVLKDNMVELFGEKVYTEGLESIKQGKDYTFETTPLFDAQFEREKEWMELNIIPLMRDEGFEELK